MIALRMQCMFLSLPEHRYNHIIESISTIDTCLLKDIFLQYRMGILCSHNTQTTNHIYNKYVLIKWTTFVDSPKSHHISPLMLISRVAFKPISVHASAIR